MNREIELHDSCVSCLTSEGDRFTLVFEPAYIHQSEGRPGLDVGTGWTQNCKLVFDGASVEGTWPEFPCDVMDGDFTLGKEVHSNSIPMPLRRRGAVSLWLHFYPGCELTISGVSVELEMSGMPRYIEEFWPATQRGATAEPDAPQASAG